MIGGHVRTTVARDPLTKVLFESRGDIDNTLVAHAAEHLGNFER